MKMAFERDLIQIRGSEAYIINLVIGQQAARAWHYMHLAKERDDASIDHKVLLFKVEIIVSHSRGVLQAALLDALKQSKKQKPHAGSLTEVRDDLPFPHPPNTFELLDKLEPCFPADQTPLPLPDELIQELEDAWGDYE
jgi:hypothetical protein